MMTVSSLAALNSATATMAALSISENNKGNPKQDL